MINITITVEKKEDQYGIITCYDVSQEDLMKVINILLPAYYEEEEGKK